MKESVVKKIGILTSGGDAPGLNAAIRAVARTAINEYGITVLGIEDGYKGLIEGRYRELNATELSGILTLGGTILGSSRCKPFKNPEPNPVTGLTPVESIKKNYKTMGLDALVILGGNGTCTTGNLLQKEGLNIIALPKTIDNDLIGTEVTFGFDSAIQIATEAIDRLHSTAQSHNRVMVIELMGHKAGWLALYAGVAGGGDVVLIPEIPYNIEEIAKHLRERKAQGKNFSIVVVAEGALSLEEAKLDKKALKQKRKEMKGSIGYRVASEIEKATGIDTRVTVLGYVQRGGIPTPADRVLATQFGVAAAHMLAKGEFGTMVVYKNGQVQNIPLEQVAGKIKKVPSDNLMLISGRATGTCFG